MADRADPFPAPFRRLLEQLLRQAVRRVGETSRMRRRRHYRVRRSESGTFSGHRAYVPGDDFRQMDWNVYARANELHVKVMEEEDRHDVLLLVDRSASMTVSDRRGLGSLRLAAILGGVALVQRRRVWLARERAPAAMWQGAGAIGQLLQGLLALPEERVHDPAPSVRQRLEHNRPHDLVWVSDFAEPERASEVLRRMRHAGVRVTGCLPQVPEDHGIGRRGLCRLIDPETGHRADVLVDAALQAALSLELQELRRAQRLVFRGHGAVLRRLEMPDAEDHRLASWEDVLWLWS